MTLNHNFGCFSGVGSGIAGNGMVLGEGWAFEKLNLKLSTNEK
jgi:hypothetical protein